MKAIFHITEFKKWQTNIDNIRDFLKNEPDALVEVVVGGCAASLFGEYSGIDLTDLIENPHVRITLSKMGMEKYSINADLLPPRVFVDDYIITRIVRLQNEGFAYIRL